MNCKICGGEFCPCCGDCHGIHLEPPPLTPEQRAEAARQERARSVLWAGMREATDWLCPICNGDVVKKSRGFGKGSDLECDDCGRRLVLTPDLSQPLSLVDL